jgi:hypothetical protein
MVGIPTPHVGADAGDPSIGHMRVDDAASATIMAASTRDHRLAVSGGRPRSLVNYGHVVHPVMARSDLSLRAKRSNLHEWGQGDCRACPPA